MPSVCVACQVHACYGAELGFDSDEDAHDAQDPQDPNEQNVDVSEVRQTHTDTHVTPCV